MSPRIALAVLGPNSPLSFELVWGYVACAKRFQTGEDQAIFTYRSGPQV